MTSAKEGWRKRFAKAYCHSCETLHCEVCSSSGNIACFIEAELSKARDEAVDEHKKQTQPVIRFLEKDNGPFVNIRGLLNNMDIFRIYNKLGVGLIIWECVFNPNGVIYDVETISDSKDIAKNKAIYTIQHWLKSAGLPEARIEVENGK